MLIPSRTTRSLDAHFSIVIEARKSAMMAAYGSAAVAAGEGLVPEVAETGEVVSVT
jgi:hypothetical protein